MNDQSLRYKAPACDLDPKNPFKADHLRRKRTADILSAFVETVSEPFVLAIDAPWGAGKSTFLNMWSQQLKNDGFKCLFFNAWETDFAESPLIAIIGELEASIHALVRGSDETSAIEQTFEKTKKYGMALVRSILPTAVKVVTSGVVDVEELSNLAEDLTKESIEKYSHHKESITGFRDSLSKLVKAIEKRESEKAKPVIFIIDELDRCRPNYAIELLENLKHLFSVNGLLFVLALDIEQMGEALKAVYGPGLNADGYLRRFIDFRFRLPLPHPGDTVAVLFSRFNIDALLASQSSNAAYMAQSLKQAFGQLFPFFRFSLRTQEQCFTQFIIAFRLSGGAVFGEYLAFIICFRAAKPELYFNFWSGRSTSDDVVQFLTDCPGGKEFLRTPLGYQIQAFLIASIANDALRNRTYQRYIDIANSGSPDAKTDAQAIIQRYGPIGNQPKNLGREIFDRVEMSQDFS